LNWQDYKRGMIVQSLCDYMSIGSGVPQGLIFGPLLLIDCVHIFLYTPTDTNMGMYAGDIFIQNVEC
jgi:hypothetical protein